MSVPIFCIPNCCCILAVDDFTRPDGPVEDGAPVDWQPDTDWDVFSNNARTSTNNDVLTCLYDIKVKLYRVSAEFIPQTSNHESDLFVLAVDADNNYHLKYRLSGQGKSDILIIRKSGGADTVLDTFDIGTLPIGADRVAVMLVVDETALVLTVVVVWTDATSSFGSFYRSEYTLDLTGMGKLTGLASGVIQGGSHIEIAKFQIDECKDCDICRDQFTREDNTDIDIGSACGWVEDAGSWEIASNELKCTSPNARVRSKTEAFSGTGTVTASVDCVGNNINDQLRLILKLKNASATDFWYAQLTIGTNKTLAIYKVINSVTTLVVSTTITTVAGSTYRLTFCYGNGQVYAHESVTDVTAVTNSGSNITDQLAAGLGTGTIAAPVTFNNFTYSYGYDTVKHPNCNRCACVSQTDTFIRPPSTDINVGSPLGWEELVGDWSVDGNNLRVNSAGAVAKCLTAPVSNYIGVKSDTGNGNGQRVISNLVDENNYYCFEDERFNPGGSGQFNIKVRENGVETRVLSTIMHQPTRSCWDPVHNRLWVSADSFTGMAALLPPMTTRAVGVGGGPEATNCIFGDFIVFTPLGGCLDCMYCTYCVDKLSPVEETRLVIAGITGACSIYNGTYIAQFIGPVVGYGRCAWRYRYTSSQTVGAFLYLITSGTSWDVQICAQEPWFGGRLNILAQWSAPIAGPKNDCESYSGTAAFIQLGDTGGACVVAEFVGSTVAITLPSL